MNDTFPHGSKLAHQHQNTGQKQSHIRSYVDLMVQTRLQDHHLHNLSMVKTSSLQREFFYRYHQTYLVGLQTGLPYQNKFFIRICRTLCAEKALEKIWLYRKNTYLVPSWQGELAFIVSHCCFICSEIEVIIRLIDVHPHFVKFNVKLRLQSCLMVGGIKPILMVRMIWRSTRIARIRSVSFNCCKISFIP